MNNITPVTNHRGREKGVLVYPVYSRRSGGLSVGINLYPGMKSCKFNCPYCEVFPFSNNAEFSSEQMKDNLYYAIDNAQKQNIPVKDICFSGNGEPTLSPFFADALTAAEKIRAEIAPLAELVIITNGTGLLQPQVFSVLKNAASNPSVNIWLKLDAGTSGWYKKINRPSVPFSELMLKIKEFSASASVTIQTMLCAIEGEPPPDTETEMRESFVCQLAATGNIRKVQLYGKIRPAPEDPHASQLPAEYLETRAESLRTAFKQKNISVPVEVYL